MVSWWVITFAGDARTDSIQLSDYSGDLPCLLEMLSHIKEFKHTISLPKVMINFTSHP